MSFKIKVEEKIDQEVFKAMNQKRVNAAVLNSLKIIGHKLVMTSRAGIRKRNKTGRVYNFRGRKHRASAPFEYPAKRTGDLGRSINYRAKRNKMEFGTDIFYAKFLQPWQNPEEPKASWKKIAPRPFLQKAHDAHKDEFQKIMSLEIKKELGI